MAKTALRRHHTERLKYNRKDYWAAGARAVGFAFSEKERLNKLARTPKRCNCWMCKNPRKVRGNKERLAKEIREDTIAASMEILSEERIQRDLDSDNEIERMMQA